MSLPYPFQYYEGVWDEISSVDTLTYLISGISYKVCDFLTTDLLGIGTTVSVSLDLISVLGATKGSGTTYFASF